jgi:hypothetical protein
VRRGKALDSPARKLVCSTLLAIEAAAEARHLPGAF